MHIAFRLVRDAHVVDITRHGVDGWLRTAAQTLRHGEDEGVEREDFGGALNCGDEVWVGDCVGTAVEHAEGVDGQGVFGAVGRPLEREALEVNSRDGLPDAGIVLGSMADDTDEVPDVGDPLGDEGRFFGVVFKAEKVV